MHITRTFHTVGQGAFYSETFEHDKKNLFVVVYDCGSYSLGAKSLDPKKNEKLKKKIHSDLGTSGSVKPEVDILFISHFDTDHINGCQFLDPKVVVIPYLTNEQINILSAINAVTGGDISIDVLRNPQSYFGQAHVIRVRPAAEGPNNNIQEGPVIDISEENGVRALNNLDQLSSGQPVGINYQQKIWEYVPFNPDWSHFFSAFEGYIRKDKDLDYDQLNKVDNGAYVSSHLKELRRVYDQMGNKNKHSLVLYSGPLCGVFESYYFAPCFHERRMIYGCAHFRGACVYYGDISVNPAWHNDYVRFLEQTNRAQYIGTIQIPHHGAWSSRGDSCVSKGRFNICVISVGETNSYGHPSARILSSIYSKGSMPVLVTEMSSSILVERIMLQLDRK